MTTATEVAVADVAEEATVAATMAATMIEAMMIEIMEEVPGEEEEEAAEVAEAAEEDMVIVMEDMATEMTEVMEATMMITMTAEAGETEVVIHINLETTTMMTMVILDQIQLNQHTEVEVHNSLDKELLLQRHHQVDLNKTLFTLAT